MPGGLAIARPILQRKFMRADEIGQNDVAARSRPLAVLTMPTTSCRYLIRIPEVCAGSMIVEGTRIVITCNRAHFLALATATETYPGLIVLNRRRTRTAEMSHVLTLLKNGGEQGLANNISFA